MNKKMEREHALRYIETIPGTFVSPIPFNLTIKINTYCGRWIADIQYLSKSIEQLVRYDFKDNVGEDKLLDLDDVADIVDEWAHSHLLVCEAHLRRFQEIQ